MSKSHHTEAQMIGALKQLEAGRKAEDVAREVGVSKHTIYAWKAKYGEMDVSQAQEAKQLRDENTKLRKLVRAESQSTRSATCRRSDQEQPQRPAPEDDTKSHENVIPQAIVSFLDFASVSPNLKCCPVCGSEVEYRDCTLSAKARLGKCTFLSASIALQRVSIDAWHGE
jgi:putative transposase